MPARSLYKTAMASCIRNIQDDAFDSISDLSYEFCRPILLKVETAEQLYTLEQNSPQIIGHDAEVWHKLLARDVPNYKKYPHEPSDPKNWYKVYQKLVRAEIKAAEAPKKKLEARMKAIEQEREALKINVVSPTKFGAIKQPSWHVSYFANKSSSMPTKGKKFTAPPASKIPYKVPLGKDLIAERKRAKEIKEAKRYPRMDDLGGVKGSSDDFDDDDLFGESSASDSHSQPTKAAPPRKIAPVKGKTATGSRSQTAQTPTKGSATARSQAPGKPQAASQPATKPSSTAQSSFSKLPALSPPPSGSGSGSTTAPPSQPLAVRKRKPKVSMFMPQKRR